MVSVEIVIHLFNCNPGDFSFAAVLIYLKCEVANFRRFLACFNNRRK